MNAVVFVSESIYTGSFYTGVFDFFFEVGDCGRRLIFTQVMFFPEFFTIKLGVGLYESIYCDYI